MSDENILVVEDERLVAEDIKETLEELGYDVIGIVDNGERAVERAREQMPDLVLMDIVLKGEMDGIKAAHIIRSELDIPVIYLTAYADDKRLKRAKATEPYGYIIKPYRERELHSNIEIALSKNKMEKKLQESERRYRALFENTGTAMALVEEDKTPSLVNEEFEKLTGYSKEEVEGKMKWTEGVTDEDLEQMEMYHEKRREDPESAPSRYTFTLVNKFGDARNILMQVGMIPGTKKSIVSLIDITADRKIFKSLRESQEAFLKFFDRTHEAVILINKERKCEEANDNFLDLFGYSHNELTQMYCSDLLVEDDAEKFYELLDKMFYEGTEEKEMVISGLAKNGKEIKLQGRFSLINSFEGDPLYVIWNIKV